MPYKDQKKAKEWQRNRYKENKKQIRTEDRERYATDDEYKKYKLEKNKQSYLKHREKRIQEMKLWRENNKKYLIKFEKERWNDPNRKTYNTSENGRKRDKRFKKSEKGRINNSKCLNKRKRNLGFNIIVPNILDEKIVWHHVDNENVIPVPEDLHLLYSGYSTETHRENLKPIIEQLYNIKF